MASYSAARPGLRSGAKFDVWLVLAAGVLTGFGLLSLYSQGLHARSETLFHKQVLNVAIGLIPAAILATVNPRVWLRASNWLYVVNLVGLIAIFKFGASRNGAARWIDLGPIQFQPSEMAKLVTIVTLAAFYTKRRDRIDRLSTFFLGLLHVAVPFVLILKQPHVGGALVLAVIWASVSIVSNVPAKFLAWSGLAGAVALAAMVAFPARFPEVFHGYHLNRLSAFEGGSAATAGKDLDYQTDEARIAFGNGGLTGTGIGKGTQGVYIPEQQTDFIFTVPGEELGLMGCTILLAAFGFLFYRLWFAALNAEEQYFKMLVAGVLGMFAFHTFVNLFMVTQMLPVIGLWLPFMSYGGTAMWLCMASVALVLNIRSRERHVMF